MLVFVLNAGSSSLKYQLIDAKTQELKASGLVERIGIDGILKQVIDENRKLTMEAPIPTHKEAIELILETLTKGDTKVINSIDEIQAIGHRVAHGGEYFKESTLVTEKVIKKIEEAIPLAPLHNPANILGMKICTQLLPKVPNVAVFDTAFHQSMKPENFMYALPYEYYEKYGVRRYGFHGTSHKYVTSRVCEILGKDYASTRIINCHVGNGASVCAVANGRVVETSM